ncbi:MAG: acetyl-CoA carboxylase, carboxyltransferase subunit beta [Peptostreptococcus porci]|nr:acetyl-CoA carboxylase, carboxyltransferase subunit beta [Peptostreptococcus porci]MDD7182764.1 acetyl-CoA carboxylase, carboxyltransferase subunit beta [Peptostreptococcus porci]MDY4561416.1 acetyl-CoA carboxylase, carboxyltransferase subunit beta [Peptostreptococcus porci]MDY5480030.1 acetyl-CoA carboxylase, carboxyltransferase subunit beta [Peptostreptococcus porci]MDY6231440.1 acetyl-CoA carboxylase, carboxyltransferase subunit beta [Peptostreptococcus porci]
MEHFKKKKYKPASNINIQPDVLIKCPECSNMIFKNDLSENLKICPTCGKYLKMNARERLKQILDKGSFVEYFRDKNIRDPLKFPKYKEKQLVLRKVLNQDEAVVCGVGKIDGNRVVIAVMDTQFMMGSMGSTVGEKITKAVELSIKKKIPLIIFTASGGARMQEGMFSLMQMAKTSQAIARHSEKGLLYISVMTDPTTGGVSASFASLGDIIIAEKNALIGFAGQRVIEQVTRTKLPEGFQRAEFLLKHGLIDMVVERNVLRETLSDILSIHLNVRKKR